MAEFEIKGPDTGENEPTGGFVDDRLTEAEINAAVVPTPLRSLKDRRQQLNKALFLDHPVPRYSDPQIFIRLLPVVAKKLNAGVKKREVQGKRDEKIDWQLLANCDLLVECCDGIYAIWPDAPDDKVSLDGADNWSKFDERTAIALGVEQEAQYPDAVVRKLFFTDGDLISAANALLEWSNNAGVKADEDF